MEEKLVYVLAVVFIAGLNSIPYLIDKENESRAVYQERNYINGSAMLNQHYNSEIKKGSV